jgi:hypothetical protein
VTQLVAAAEAGEAVPATVLDAVLARIGRLDPAEQAALEQVSVVPSEAELPLARRARKPARARGRRAQRAGRDA